MRYIEPFLAENERACQEGASHNSSLYEAEAIGTTATTYQGATKQAPLVELSGSSPVRRVWQAGSKKSTRMEFLLTVVKEGSGKRVRSWIRQSVLDEFIRRRERKERSTDE